MNTPLWKPSNQKKEKSLLNDYGKGVYISPEQHQQDVAKKRLDK